MKKLILFLFVVIFVIVSCSKDKNGGGDNPNRDEMEVEMTFLSPSAESTRATRAFTPEEITEIEKGTVDEKKINTLDLLIFKDDKLQYRRHAVPFGPTGLTFKATLKVDESGTLTVHFVANARLLIEGLIDQGKLVENESWETIRLLLVDSPARTFEKQEERSNLPMWGTKTGLTVSEKIVTHWKGIQLLRAVAGVDVYVDALVDNFDLLSAYLYFVPNTGWWAPTLANYGTDYDWLTLKSQSPPEMVTGVGVKPNVVGPIYVETGKKHIANKFYLYDNDTDAVSFATVTRQYTRLIVGGEYDGETYYYPIDFVKGGSSDTDPISYDQITRNWKHLFLITTVSGPGYPDEETASKEPPVHMTINIFNWNATNPNRGHSGFDGQYYVSLAEKNINLARLAGSTRKVKFASNAKPSIILMDFTTKVNGKMDVITNGIENKRFRVEKIVADVNGKEQVTELVFTAIGPYQTDPTLAHENGDQIKLKVGNIEFTIDINQLNRDPGDWENGGNENIVLDSN